MEEYLKELEEIIHEPYIKELEKIILSVKGEKRWVLLKNIALDHNYRAHGEDSYKNDKDYLMKMNKKIIFLENVTQQAYEEIRDVLKRKGDINKTNPSLITQAISVGSSTIGGGVIGYLLIQAGLNPLVMIPSVIIPPGVCMYELLKQSIRENKKSMEIDKALNKYKKNIFYDDDAAKRFNYRLYEREIKEKIKERAKNLTNA